MAIFIGIGALVVAVLVGATLLGTKKNHLQLDGRILHVRVLALNPKASIVVVDFRARNPSAVQFMVKDVRMEFDPASGDAVDGQSISKPDMENVFKYEKLLGPQYNDVLAIPDRIAPHQSEDRMFGARFEVGEAAIDARKGIRLRIEDMDGATAELSEAK
ncbi:MAG: hypothetical protein ACRD30_00705 [Bryobacteraceae bacterium]